MTKWIANLPLRAKFALLGFIALVMAAAPSAYMLRDTLGNLSAMQQEVHGLPRAEAMLKVIKLTQEHRGLSAAVLSGDSDKQVARQERQAMVDSAWGEVRRELEASAANSEQKEADAIILEWKALATEVTAGSVQGTDSTRRHTKLIARSMFLLEDIVSSSGLALDPDTESYYLIMSAFKDWPRLTEKLGQARARGAAILAKKTASPDSSAALVNLLDGADAAAQDAFRDIEKSGVRNQPDFSELQSTFTAAKEGLDKGRALIGRLAHAEDLTFMTPGDYIKNMTEVIRAQFAVSDQIVKKLDARLTDRVAQVQSQITLTMIAMGAAMTLGVAVAMIIVRTTNQAVKDAVRAAKALASGDLTQEIRSDQRDEVGELLCAIGEAVGQLKQTIMQIRTTSESVATASGQIAQGNLDLSTRTENQAASLQQTAASMEQMSATVTNNTDTAQEANRLALQASSEASHSGEIFSQVVSKMEAIKQASQKIADINSVIDGIAFQTNILALNAAVEAARAGEQGRGFAVVAAEVRSLAQRSAQAAKEIKSLINNSSESVDAGYSLATETGQSIQRLVTQVQRVSTLMGNIAIGSEQQQLGINQVNQAVISLDQSTQQNAALVEEASAAASSLNDQAVRLREAVGQFKLT